MHWYQETTVYELASCVLITIVISIHYVKRMIKVMLSSSFRWHTKRWKQRRRWFHKKRICLVKTIFSNSIFSFWKKGYKKWIERIVWRVCLSFTTHSLDLLMSCPNCVRSRSLDFGGKKISYPLKLGLDRLLHGEGRLGMAWSSSSE